MPKGLGVDPLQAVTATNVLLDKLVNMLVKKGILTPSEFHDVCREAIHDLELSDDPVLREGADFLKKRYERKP